MTRWTEQDFDRLSWHDNHVHAMRVHEGEHGTGRLEIDLDFIVEWLTPTDESFRFLVAPATLIFHRVTDLKVTLDYAGCAMGPFTIDGIERDVKIYPNGFQLYQWRIPVNFPNGEISFEAEGFVQELRAVPIEVDTQGLSDEQRTER